MSEGDGLIADLINFQAAGGLEETEVGSAGKERAAKEAAEKKEAMNTGLFAGIFGEKNTNKAPPRTWEKEEEFDSDEEDEEEKRRRREARKRRRALLGKKKGPKLKLKVKVKTTSSKEKTKVTSPVKLTPPPPPPPDETLEEQKEPDAQTPEQVRIRDMQSVIEKQQESIKLLKKRISDKKPKITSKREWLLQMKSQLNAVKTSTSPKQKLHAQRELRRLLDMRDEFSSLPSSPQEEKGDDKMSAWSSYEGSSKMLASPSSKRPRRRRAKSVRHYAKIVMKFALRSHQNILDHALNDISSAFASYDAQGDGMLRPAEFAAALEQLDYGLTVHLIRDITRVLVKHCALENNDINYMDFLHDMERSGSYEGAKMSSRNFHRADDLEPDFHPRLRPSDIEKMSTTSLDAKFLSVGTYESNNIPPKIPVPEEGDDWPGLLSGVPAPSPTKVQDVVTTTTTTSEDLVKSDEAKQNEWERKAKAYLSEELVETLRDSHDQNDAAKAILEDLPDVETVTDIVTTTSASKEMGTQSDTNKTDVVSRYDYAVAIESYDTGDMSGHLKIQIGDVIQVLDEKPSAVDDGMWFGRVPGETPGIFPAKCVQKRKVSDRDRDPVWQFLRRHWLEGYYEGLTKYLGVASLNDVACFVTEDMLYSLKMRPIERRKLMWAIEKLRPGSRRSGHVASSPTSSMTSITPSKVIAEEVDVPPGDDDWENRLDMLRREDKKSPVRGSSPKNLMMMTTTASELDTGVGVNLSDALTASAAMSQYELQVGEFVCLRNAKHKSGQAANRFNPRYWTVRVLAIGASGLVRVQWFVEIRIGSRLFRPTEKVFVINTTHVDIKMLDRIHFEFKTRLWCCENILLMDGDDPDQLPIPLVASSSLLRSNFDVACTLNLSLVTSKWEDKGASDLRTILETTLKSTLSLLETNKKKNVLGGDVFIERIQNEIFSGRGDVLLFVRIRGTSSLNVSRAERMTVENVCTLIHHRLGSDRTREMLLKHGVKLMSTETPCVSSLDSHARTIPEVKRKSEEEKNDSKNLRANDFVCFRNVYFSVSKPEDPTTNPIFWVGRINSIKKDNSQRVCDLQWYVETAQGSGLYRRATKTFRQLSNQLYLIEDMERDDVADNIWRRRRVYKPSAGSLSDSSSAIQKSVDDNKMMIAAPSENARDAEMLRIWREKAEMCDEFKERAQKAEKELESLRERLKNFGGDVDDSVYKKNSSASDLESQIAKVEKDNQKQFEKMERNLESQIKSLTPSSVDDATDHL